MSKVNYGGYQHREWFRQQHELIEKQEFALAQLLKEFEYLLAVNRGAQFGQALMFVTTIQHNLSSHRQLITDMRQRLGAPKSTNRDVASIDQIAEVLVGIQARVEQLEKRITGGS